MDRVTSRLASAIVDVVEFCRVWDRINPIIRNKTDNCSEHSPKIGPLTDLHTRWHGSYFSSKKRSSYKTNNIWNCNSNKSDGECSVNVRDLPWNLLGICWWNFPSLYSHFFKKARGENKVQVKVMVNETGKRTCCPWILPRKNDQPIEQSPQNLKKRSFVWRLYAPTWT